MIVNLRKILALVWIISLFCLLTFLFYQVITWVLETINPRYQYKKPYGNSVEVIGRADEAEPLSGMERLHYFWWNGE